MTKIIVQARKMNAGFCEPLENWFSELLEWNMDNVKDSFMTEWRSVINTRQPQTIGFKENQKLMGNMFTLDLVLLKEMSKTYIEKEKYLQELLETKKYLEKRCDELEKYIQNLVEGKDWLEKQCKKKEEYIQELTSRKNY